jgi:hypothetical protein
MRQTSTYTTCELGLCVVPVVKSISKLEESHTVTLFLYFDGSFLGKLQNIQMQMKIGHNISFLTDNMSYLQ